MRPLNDRSEGDKAETPSQPTFVPGHKASTEPRSQDVICGRGKCMRHPGNQRLASLINARRKDYQKATRREDKTRIKYEIVHTMQHGPKPAR